jgi:hypothetical protein
MEHLLFTRLSRPGLAACALPGRPQAAFVQIYKLHSLPHAEVHVSGSRNAPANPVGGFAAEQRNGWALRTRAPT